MDLADLATWGVQVALVIALVEAAKQVAPSLDKRWLPLLAVVFGVAVTTVARYGGDVALTMALGVGVGLAGIGLFSGVRAVAGK